MIKDIVVLACLIIVIMAYLSRQKYVSDRFDHIFKENGLSCADDEDTFRDK